ncbi:MAG: cytochrome c oxidase assembly protein [Alphaproteobacteria bacterium]|nr:cytochrome c oxidase assembly protein [Alphaproteobacteria bacterium]NCQ66375.1 cytochrome c oxidase assembly protein [Alphaproteobacteria bacterium]NCT06861.1 cytochrome c oxidase assembly protein [Alphaproteobacteria bacterium]
MVKKKTTPPLKQSNRHGAIILFSLVFAMLALSFASVPLYRIFCQRTGYGGTVKIALQGAGYSVDRVIIVRFNADVHRDLPWDFKPLRVATTVYVGETGLGFYEVTNRTSKDFTGIATYNVTPDKAAQYFNKIHCFCFEEQIINAHETASMPVQFFIDPAIMNDPNCKDVETITLSYTFFDSKDPNIPAILGLPNATRHQVQQFNKR